MQYQNTVPFAATAVSAERLREPLTRRSGGDVEQCGDASDHGSDGFGEDGCCGVPGTGHHGPRRIDDFLVDTLGDRRFHRDRKGK